MRKKYFEPMTEVIGMQTGIYLLAGSETPQSAPGVKSYRVSYGEAKAL